MKHALLERMSRLLPSSRPRWAMKPKGPSTHFVETLLFVASMLEHAGIGHVIHYGSLLGATRLGGPLPWDEDHDVFVLGVNFEELRDRVGALLAEHRLQMIVDPRGFYWVRELGWMAASGHLALEFLPPLVATPTNLPIWDGGAPHLVEGELYPLRTLPFYDTYIHAPQATEALLDRLYGSSGGETAMARFRAPPISDEARQFWRQARQPGALDWPAISARYKARSGWRHHLHTPWWWFNGGYIVLVNALKRWARARLASG